MTTSAAIQQLEFDVGELTYALDDRAAKCKEQIELLQGDLRGLEQRLRVCFEANAARKPDTSFDSAYVRRFEWLIQDASEKMSNMEVEEAIWSGKFEALGIGGMQLEFFPKGRKTSAPGNCALFFWCPGGVTVQYQLRVGGHVAAPESDAYEARMGHGHSNFCQLEAQINKKDNTISISVEIRKILFIETPLPGLRLKNQGPEMLIAKESEVLCNRHLNEVQWKIYNIRQVKQDVPKGLALCSPLFSVAGVRNMLLEFYPNGIDSDPSQARKPRLGYCGFYVRCQGGQSLVLTLFVGKSAKGPIPTTFTGNLARGLPEFCPLDDQLVEGENDLVVGVRVVNSNIQEDEDGRGMLIIDDEIIQDPVVGNFVMVTRDLDRYEAECRQCGLSWPNVAEDGTAREGHLGRRGKVETVSIAQGTVQLDSLGEHDLPIRGLSAYGRWLPPEARAGMLKMTKMSSAPMGTRPDTSL